MVEDWGLSRGLPNSPQDYWVRTAVRRPVLVSQSCAAKQKHPPGYGGCFCLVEDWGLEP